MDPHRGRSGFPGSYPHSFESGSRPESTSRHSYHGSPSDALDVPSKRKRSVERNTVSELDHRESRATKRTRPSGNLKFACPYFKRDPTRYTRRQACSGPGFTSISRLKEHIYRGHRQPEYQCIRCYSIFGNKDLLEDHQRALVPCEISSSRSSDGISEAQYTRLRRKASGAKSDAERWEDVYRILFPTAPSIPSCYYETHDTMAISRLDRAGLEHMENTVMAGLERDLEDRLDQVGADIKASIFSMVKERLGHTIQEYLASNEESVPNSFLTPTSRATSQVNSQAASQVDSPADFGPFQFDHTIFNLDSFDPAGDNLQIDYSDPLLSYLDSPGRSPSTF